MDFLIGGLAAAGAGFFSNPLDVLKTRMQLQGELKARGAHAVHYRNVFHAAVVVVKNDGVWGLQKGVAPAITMHFIRNFVRLGSYQWAKDKGYITDENGKTIFYRSFLISSAAGAAGAFFGSPLFLIKTQLQSATTEAIAVGHQHRHSGTLEAIKSIYRNHGVSFSLILVFILTLFFFIIDLGFMERRKRNHGESSCRFFCSANSFCNVQRLFCKI